MFSFYFNFLNFCFLPNIIIVRHITESMFKIRIAGIFIILIIDHRHFLGLI